MKRLDIIRRAGRNLRQAKIRTFLTALAISVGAFTITLAFAAGNGGRAYTQQLLSSNGDNRSIYVYAQQSDQARNSAPKKYGDSTPSGQWYVTDQDRAKIQKVAGIESITPLYSVVANYIQGVGSDKYNVTLTVKDDNTGVELAAGSMNGSRVADGTVVLTHDYVQPLGFKSDADAIGKTVTIHVPSSDLTNPLGGKDVKFTVAAVAKKTNTTLRNSSGVWISVSDGAALYKYQTPAGAAQDQYGGFTVQVASGATVETVRDDIKSLGYDAMSLQDIQQILFTFVDVVMGGAAGFGALAIIASIFGIINTQYISVLERTQQIGLMKALGARRRDIGKLFRYEAAWVGFLGGVLGTGLALPFQLLNPLIADKLNLDKGTNLLIFDPIVSVVLVLALMLIAVVAGYFPSRKASKLDPIEALRTE